MIENLNRILKVILNLVNEAYSSSKEDRHKLHEIEWSGDNDAPSILGESEIRADAIIGLVRKYLQAGMKDDKYKTLTMLKKYSVYNSPTLLNWLLDESAKYRKFSLYLHNLEHLRLTLIEIINNNEIVVKPH